MSNMIIKSMLRKYTVDFVSDYKVSLIKEIDEGAFVIIDKNVYKIFKKQIDPLLPDGRFFVIEANENNKSIDKCKEIIEILVEKNVRRNNRLVAIGGGIIQDITAFTASILYRGIEWSFIPTTLLAQADSCIGSKTSINLAAKKNLIGNFYPPSNIYIDTFFLKSLTQDDIKSGIGEIFHFYFYANSPLLDKLVLDYEQVLENIDLITEYIYESLRIKKSVVEIDEFDKNERNKFNYGHTFGHALETLTNYEIKHGQAVTTGMDIANYISLHLGLINEELFNKVHAILVINIPAYNFSKWDLAGYYTALSKDKKNIGSSVGCILIEEPGKLIKKQIPLDSLLKDIIKNYFSKQIYKLK